MTIIISEKDNIAATMFLAAIIFFLSCPYLVKAESDVNSFFPEDFIKKGFFNEEVNNSLVTRAGKQKPAIESVRQINSQLTSLPASPAKQVPNVDCRQMIRNIKDSFAIPTELVSCANSIKTH